MSIVWVLVSLMYALSMKGIIRKTPSSLVRSNFPSLRIIATSHCLLIFKIDVMMLIINNNPNMMFAKYLVSGENVWLRLDEENAVHIIQVMMSRIHVFGSSFPYRFPSDLVDRILLNAFVLNHD